MVKKILIVDDDDLIIDLFIGQGYLVSLVSTLVYFFKTLGNFNFTPDSISDLSPFVMTPFKNPL